MALPLPIVVANVTVQREAITMAATVISDRNRILKEVRASLEREPRINLHKYPIQMEYQDGVLTLEGETEHIAAKKLSMELAAAVHGVSGIVDRLHVAPATRMGDGAILDAVRDALLQEPSLLNCTKKEEEIKEKDYYRRERSYGTVVRNGCSERGVAVRR